jgi:hypothetical protein
MRSAELAGKDPARPCGKPFSPVTWPAPGTFPAVIDARMRRSVNTMTPRPGGRWAGRVPEAADPQIREYLGHLATLMDERRERIGQHAAEHQPAWAVKAVGSGA